MGEIEAVAMTSDDAIATGGGASMSTVDRPQKATLPPLIAGQRLDRHTFHERYETMPPSTHAELIGGIVHMPSPRSQDHGDENVPVLVWLDYYAEHTPGVLANLGSTVLLDNLAEPQPDSSLRILPELGGRTRIEDGFIAEAPELIVEIARSSRRIDLGPKKADYERAGCPEYLVVALAPPAIFWFVLRDGRFVEKSPDAEGLYRSEVFPGLWLEPTALFSGDRAALRAVVDRGVATPEHGAFVDRLDQAGGR
jgi:Uma2 family endonuclease